MFCVDMIASPAVGGVVLSRGAGDAAPRLPGAQALVPAVALRAAARRPPRACAEDGLDQDAQAARRRAPEEEGERTSVVHQEHDLFNCYTLHIIK